LPQAGFHYSTDQLLQLVALPGLIGSLMRFPYTFAVTTFGGRNWTIFSASVLFIPTIALAYYVTQPDTPFSTMLWVAALAGLGGGNFASSMANISFFYPDRMKGWALGLNAAGGNIGVSSVQLLTPILMGVGFINLYLAKPGPGGIYLQNAGLMWLLPLGIAVYGAVRYMNNLTSARSTFRDQLAIIGRKHTWIMSYIYIGTFGSFIGYSAAFPLLIKTQFPAITVGIAFLGPLVGSVARPFGGLLADKIGGAIVTFWNFIAMGAATVGVMYFVNVKDFNGFLTMFLILFVTTGIGNGSTYRMIPSIFREENLRKAMGSGDAGRALALKAASIESGAAVGFIGAVGACGGYLIPRGFGASIATTGSPHLALAIYLAFYVSCIVLTWRYYLRKTPLASGVPSLAEARV
jgi:NNP family nitrate/nitrite transporter-like MFS transporter